MCESLSHTAAPYPCCAVPSRFSVFLALRELSGFRISVSLRYGSLRRFRLGRGMKPFPIAGRGRIGCDASGIPICFKIKRTETNTGGVMCWPHTDVCGTSLRRLEAASACEPKRIMGCGNLHNTSPLLRHRSPRAKGAWRSCRIPIRLACGRCA